LSSVAARVGGKRAQRSTHGRPKEKGEAGPERGPGAAYRHDGESREKGRERDVLERGKKAKKKKSGNGKRIEDGRKEIDDLRVAKKKRIRNEHQKKKNNGRFGTRSSQRKKKKR